MGKLKVFEIAFSNDKGVYHAGSPLEGQVIVELTQPMKMRGIKLRIKGTAQVFWSESKDNRYDDRESYLDHEVTLFGYVQNTTTELTQGGHIFPFRFQLPAGLPSSFESHIPATAYVRYRAVCKIDEPWKTDYITKQLFTVISFLDLNNFPCCAAEQVKSNQKNLCCYCCASGPIEATFRIDRSGYVPGEAIKLDAEISNGTSRRIDKSYVDLRMKITLHALFKSKTFYSEVTRVTRPGIERYGNDVWSGEELVIPPLPPSFLLGCRMIDLEYILQLNVDPKGPSLDLEVPLNIIIGTLPLKSAVQQYLSQTPNINQPTNTRMATYLASSESIIFDTQQTERITIPPLTYSECITPITYSECIAGPVSIRNSEDNKYTRGKLEYTPASLLVTTEESQNLCQDRPRMWGALSIHSPK